LVTGFLQHATCPIFLLDWTFPIHIKIIVSVMKRSSKLTRYNCSIAPEDIGIPHHRFHKLKQQQVAFQCATKSHLGRQLIIPITQSFPEIRL
jgi:hypothetical protein